MSKGDLINQVAESVKLTKGQATDAVNTVLNAIEKSLKEGDKIAIVGFGTFSVAGKPARIGRNPKTKEAINIAAKNVVKFKAGKELSSSVN